MLFRRLYLVLVISAELLGCEALSMASRSCHRVIAHYGHYELIANSACRQNSNYCFGVTRDHCNDRQRALAHFQACVLYQCTCSTTSSSCLNSWICTIYHYFPPHTSHPTVPSVANLGGSGLSYQTIARFPLPHSYSTHMTFSCIGVT